MIIYDDRLNRGGTGDGEDAARRLAPYYRTAVLDSLARARDCYTPAFGKISAPLGLAFALGANIAIAEVHTTLDEQHRRTVVAALNNARQGAVSLQLPPAMLDECIAMATGSTPLREVQQQIQRARNNYESML